MKKESPINKHKKRKGGYEGVRVWQAYRLEGVVKNVGIKPVRKTRKANESK